ncbi:MAG: class I SAM-dependent methyltransferase [Candidatus Nealsonbacteria bacterium]
MNKYSFLKYDHKTRWISYWHQINEVLSLAPKKVLEVGIGNKTVLNYLKNQGVEVITLDIDEKLKPDIVGNVLKMPFQDNSFDVILCAEVLEHLPFKEFDKALEELERVSKQYVVLSLPHFGHTIKLGFKVPLIKEKRLVMKFSFFPKHQFNGEHYWEIGKKGYPLSKIKKIIEQYFVVKKEFIPFDNQYHHFFVLKKL